MAHDVFISHAHKDKSIADAICEKLESAQVRCWIAERDISAGEDWTEATRQAIGSSRVLVLVLSENANAAPHIEREIAHAFYTKRPIVPVRLSKTLPRRDFLFYLGNIPWFDAVSPPAEEHLEALTASINQIVRGRPVNPNPRPAESLSRNKARIDFSDSWFGALRASHYQTLAILKWTGIAASLFGVVWVLWFVHQRTKDGMSSADPRPRTLHAFPRATSTPSTHPTGDAPETNPALTFSRFGLWVRPDGAATPAAEEGSQSGSATPARQPSSVPTSATPAVNQKTTGGVENSTANDNASGKSVHEERREGHKGKSRSKSRTHATRESRAAHLKNRLKAIWRRLVGGKKETENR